MVKLYPYTKNDPPPSCFDCVYHTFTFSPTTKCHTLWSDYCANIKMKFGKMHIVLRGEYRSMAKHDEDDLKKNLPFECPYFDSSKVYWEMYGRIKMDAEVFIYECDVHFMDYAGWYVYGMPETIKYVKNSVSEALKLHYLTVADKDKIWFLENFGDTVVVLSDISPNDWHYPVPPQPV